MPVVIFAFLQLIVLGCAVPAVAHTTVIMPLASSFPYQQWLEEAKAPTPNVTIEITDTARCEAVVVGCTDGYSFIGLAGSRARRLIFLHEIGHIFEYEYLRDDPATRERIIRLAGHPKMVWWSWGTGPEGAFNEAFADAYAQCARTQRVNPRATYGTGTVAISGPRLRRICGLIRSYPY